jgi:hypothetical protein
MLLLSEQVTWRCRAVCSSAFQTSTRYDMILLHWHTLNDQHFCGFSPLWPEVLYHPMAPPCPPPNPTPTLEAAPLQLSQSCAVSPVLSNSVLSHPMTGALPLCFCV